MRWPLKILRRDIDKLGYSSSFTIYDSADSERVVKDAEKALNVDEKAFPPKLVMGYISRAKDALKLAGAYADESFQTLFQLTRSLVGKGDRQNRPGSGRIYLAPPLSPSLSLRDGSCRIAFQPDHPVLSESRRNTYVEPERARTILQGPKGGHRERVSCQFELLNMGFGYPGTGVREFLYRDEFTSIPLLYNGLGRRLKVHRPLEFYAAFFSIRAKAFDATIMCQGMDMVKAKIKEILNAVLGSSPIWIK